MVLLCTVGKPMDRYLIPVMPVMFWTLGTAVVFIFETIVQFVRTRLGPANLAPHPAS
jgi:hypothetical protein